MSHVVPWGVGGYFSASVHNETVVVLKRAMLGPVRLCACAFAVAKYVANKRK